MPDLCCLICRKTFYAEYALDFCGACERAMKAEHDQQGDDQRALDDLADALIAHEEAVTFAFIQDELAREEA